MAQRRHPLTISRNGSECCIVQVLREPAVVAQRQTPGAACSGILFAQLIERGCFGRAQICRRQVTRIDFRKTCALPRNEVREHGAGAQAQLVPLERLGVGFAREPQARAVFLDGTSECFTELAVVFDIETLMRKLVNQNCSDFLALRIEHRVEHRVGEISERRVCARAARPGIETALAHA